MKTDEQIKSEAEEYAKFWLVNAIDKVVASLKEPDDVPMILEVAFTDGYRTGYRHACKSFVPTCEDCMAPVIYKKSTTMSDKPQSYWVWVDKDAKWLSESAVGQNLNDEFHQLEVIPASAYESIKSSYDKAMESRELQAETILKLTKERDEARAELEEFVKFDAFLKDDGDVSANVYESAVKGRQDFRNALKAECAKSVQLERDLGEARAEAQGLRQCNDAQMNSSERNLLLAKSARMMSLIRKMANSAPDKQQCEMWDIQAEACEILAEFKGESAE